MSIQAQECRCPLCGQETITIKFYEARDRTWRAQSDPCEFCGYFVDPLALRGTVDELREVVTAKPQTHVGQLATWTVKGTAYDGTIEMFLAPGYDCRELGKHGVELAHGPRVSKYPRYLLRSGDDYHAILTRSVFIVPKSTTRSDG